LPGEVAQPNASTIPFLFQGGFDGSSAYIGVYGGGQSNLASLASSGNLGITRIAVGGRFDPADGSGASKWPGDVGEVLVYNSWLSDLDRASVLNYLSNKWFTASYPNYAAISSSASSTFTVDPLPVSLTGTRGYDATTNAAAAILSVANVVSGDTVTVASGTGGLASRDVGSRSITSFGTLALGGSDGTNYTLTGASGSVTITIISPSYSALSSPPICQGTSPTTLSGSIAAGGVSPTNQNVAITLNAVTQNAVVQSDGSFSSSFNTTALTVGGSPYTITYAYTSDGNFNSVTNTSNTVVVNAPVTVTAGTDRIICYWSPTTTALGGNFGGGATSATWTNNGGDGVFTSVVLTTPL